MIKEKIAEITAGKKLAIKGKAAKIMAGEKFDEYKPLVAIAIAIILFGCVCISIPNTPASTVEKAEAQTDAISDRLLFKEITDKIVLPADSYEEAVEQGLDVVEYDEMTEEEASALGYYAYTFSDGTRVWYSKRSIYDLYAHDDGSMNEYEEGYFVAHSGSYYGGQIASLYPGATVNVNGQDITIDGYVYDNYNSSTLWDIRRRVGWDKVCFQTCVGGDGTIIVYYGHYADGSTPEIARRQNSSSNKQEETAEERQAREEREAAAQAEAMRLAREKAAAAQAEAQTQKEAAEAEAQAAAEAAALEKQQQAQEEADAAAAAAAAAVQASNSASSEGSGSSSAPSGGSSNTNAE